MKFINFNFRLRRRHAANIRESTAMMIFENININRHSTVYLATFTISQVVK